MFQTLYRFLRRPATNGHAKRHRRFTYDAAEDRKERKTPLSTLRSEDDELTTTARRKIIATARDLPRQWALASWAIRRHLDFVSSFRFEAQTGDTTTNERLEELVRWWSRPANFEAAGRHPRRRFMRLAEARRSLDGDLGILKLRSGRVQAVEGDRIRDPSPMPDGQRNTWKHGVRTNDTGRALAYALHKRNGQRFEFERIVPASQLALHGYFSRFDQTRGIGLVAPGLNDFRDTYELATYMKLKAKISQLFGLVTKRDDEEPLGTITTNSNTGTGAEVDFGRPFHLDLDRDDVVEWVESKTPPAELVNFLKLAIHIALLSLDIPFSILDASATNFFGSRSALIIYLKACKEKRADNADLLTGLTYWRLSQWVADGTLALDAGLTVPDLRFGWIPDGIPWWNPTQEIKGNTMAIAAGLDNPQRICLETGTTYKKNIDAIAEAVTYARSKGIPIDQTFWPKAAAQGQPTP